MSRHTRAFLLLLLTFTAFACAPKPKPTLRRLYERLEVPLKALDFSSLRTRRIAIDPGHGGVFRGARGIGGLDEADVNLGVALHLWGLLEEAGAEVLLTRKTDKDFVDGDSLRLREDLQTRIDIVNQFNPDFFISLHHNADVEGDTTFNEIQIYYKMIDKGPSLDMARIFARHLLRNLGETKTRVIPGNYYVLRNCEVPSILCEPSYITNTEVESKLKLAEKQRLEAEAYFVAVVDYLSRGVPRIVDLKPVGTLTTDSPRVEVVFDEASLMDFSTVTVHLDGRKLKPTLLGPNHLIAFPEMPLRSGRHSVEATGRAIGGNSSREAETDFWIDLKPQVLRLSTNVPVANPPFPQKLTALVLDHNGNPVMDSTVVVFSWADNSVSRLTMNGKTSMFIGKDIPFGERTISAVCEALEHSVALGDEDHIMYVSGFVVDRDGIPVQDATVVASSASASATTDRYGYFCIETEELPSDLRIHKVGYKKTYASITTDRSPVVEMDEFYHGLGPDLTVAIDAEGGGEDTGWIGPTGITASSLNLAIARRLAGFLSSVGISANLTRDGDQKVSQEQRVMRCESQNPALLISLSHIRAGQKIVRVGHYPGSVGGGRLSQYMSQEIGSSLDYETEILTTADYLIQQTSCPAVKVTFLTTGTMQDETDLSNTSNVWTRSYAIFCAVLRHLGVDEKKTFSIAGLVTHGSKPCPNAVVLVDGTLETTVSEEGEFTLKLLQPGRHVAEVFSTRLGSQRVDFDEQTGFIEIELER